MPHSDLILRLIDEYEKPFSGWDFSYLKGKMEEDPLPWDYRSIISKAINESKCMLDMGTGRWRVS
jgi:hypothetical protein